MKSHGIVNQLDPEAQEKLYDFIYLFFSLTAHMCIRLISVKILDDRMVAIPPSLAHDHFI